jgi:hypothetical protein
MDGREQTDLFQTNGTIRIGNHRGGMVKSFFQISGILDTGNPFQNLLHKLKKDPLVLFGMVQIGQELSWD